MSERLIDWMIFPAALALSLALTALLRRHALAHKLVDVPNERSSHHVPMPRNGGVAIVITYLVGLLVLAKAGSLSVPLFTALLGAGGAVAVVGFIDDRYGVAARWRLAVHFGAAAWALWRLGGAPTSLPVLGHDVALGGAGAVLMVLYLVWLLNLYNFMDGIDGIAGVEAVTACFGGALFYWLAAPNPAAWAPLLLLLCSVLGFLVWNFPTAKIFLGDAGSGFLGLTLGVLSIDAALKVPSFSWAWLILLGVFVVDATITLLRRGYRREKLYVAHRSHAYQRAARRYGSHRRVTLSVGLINLLWLLPLALLVALGVLDGVIGVCVAYAPLVWLAYRFNAGASELPGD
jgi:Fuc2NAc and GlcNAc transferase